MYVLQKIIVYTFLMKLFEKSVLTEDQTEIKIRIADGDFAKHHIYAKHVVSVRTREEYKFFGDNHICSGAVISSRKIVTAAQCVQPRMELKGEAKDFIVIAGSPQRLEMTPYGKLYNVSEMLVHPHYSSSPLKADIAVLILSSDIEESNYIQQIPMADRSPGEDRKCTTLGWGRIFDGGPSPDDILKADLYIWNAKSCRSVFRRMQTCEVCAGDNVDNIKSTCAGDNGSPLICDGVLYGIVSYGIGCGYSNEAVDFFTDVACYKEWIENSTRNSKPKLELLIAISMFLIGKLKISH